MSMTLHAHGVRGSYPVPGKDTIRYGGNTTSFSVTKTPKGFPTVRVVFDFGTGAIRLSKQMLKNFFSKEESGNVVFCNSHLHPDHREAFPFLAVNYLKNYRLYFVGMETLKKNIGHALDATMSPPMFPIELRDLKSRRTYHSVSDGDSFFILNDGSPVFGLEKMKTYQDEEICFLIQVMKSYGPSHPQQGSLYYRITDLETKKSICTIWDLESHVGGDQRVINFAKGCTLMCHDTMYTAREYSDEKMVVQGFGHSTYEMALDNAYKAGAQTLLCMHYNPSHTDDSLDQLQKEVDATNEMTRPLDGPKLKIIFAREDESYSV